MFVCVYKAYVLEKLCNTAKWIASSVFPFHVIFFIIVRFVGEGADKMSMIIP